MITDLILLLVLFGLLFGIFIFVSSIAPHSSTPSSTKAKGVEVDWEHNELKLKTNLRPVTQQDLLENAEGRGRDGGKFMAQHAESFSFGKKDT